MQAVEAIRTAKVVDLAAFRFARTAKVRDDAMRAQAAQYCDAADSAGWYHREAVREDLH
jgi:hypothetical protein